MILLTVTIDENILDTMRDDLYTFRQYATYAVLILGALVLVLFLIALLQGIKLKNLQRELEFPGKKKYSRDEYDYDDEYEDDGYGEDEYREEEEAPDPYDEEEDEDASNVTVAAEPGKSDGRSGDDYEEYDDEEEDDFVTAAYFARKREEAAEKKASKKAERKKAKAEDEPDDDLEIMDLNDL